MKKIIYSLFGLLTFQAIGQTSINDARTNYSVGQVVTIKGVSANGPNQLGSIRYIQDATGGLPAFGNNLSSVQLGDSVTVTGELLDFNGLLEISPTTSFTKHGAVGAPAAIAVTIPSIGESLEGRLLTVDNVVFVEMGSFAANTNYTVNNSGNSLRIRISSGSNLVGTTIPTSAVTISGLLSQFNADYQLLPRFTADIVTYVAPEKEINVKIETKDYLNGANYFIGNKNVVELTIENAGTEDLTISDINFTGANASDFSVSAVPSLTIPSNSSQTFDMQYNASANGSTFATLTIVNDDADEAEYVINIEGVGMDDLATEPASNPSTLTISNVSAYSMNGTYSATAPENKYIVLLSKVGPVSSTPMDGTSYKRGDLIGNAKVAYIGSSTSFVPRGIIANQNLNFAVFAFNGQDGFENYKTDSPANQSVTSLGQQIGTYYQGIDKSSSNFIQALTAKINPHTFISYFNYKTTIMNQFEVRDTTDGRSWVLCAYTGDRILFQDPFDWTATGFSREHTYAHSWMPTFPADDPAKPEYSDFHNLYPVLNSEANGVRSNLPLGIITGDVLYTHMEGRAGYGPSGQLLYEPRDMQKGNAARAIMYMAVAYNGIEGKNWAIPTNQSQQILKDWHYADLPDNYEIARNEYIYNVQGNRNPFVDSVDYACFVNFSNMNHMNCNLSSIKELLQSNLVIFPVPSTAFTYVQVNDATLNSIEIFDLTGKVVYQENLENSSVYKVDNSKLKKGAYLIKVNTDLGSTTGRLVID